jgi:hypothetical protein
MINNLGKASGGIVSAVGLLRRCKGRRIYYGNCGTDGIIRLLLPAREYNIDSTQNWVDRRHLIIRFMGLVTGQQAAK